MVATVKTVAFQGVDVHPVDVQVQISNGLPSFTIVGLPDKAVAESKERVRSALHSLGLSMPPKRLTVNLAPADLAKEGSHYDLPIAIAVLSAMGVLPKDEMRNNLVLGELALDATIRAVAGILPAALHASANDNTLVCPQDCGGEAAWAGDLQILAPQNLLQFINHVKGTQILTQPEPKRADTAISKTRPCFSDVKGQETAKRALEIAAAGGHNLLMIGPPGSGKSMLASCVPDILPPLTAREALEVSTIHSLAGNLPEGGLMVNRPFRDPHHSASLPALVGGGHKVKPGEISLAHNGILFLDELPEFARNTLESLRQPLETGTALIARANAHLTYPARFQLIAAMNPCRCGHLGDEDLECTKAPRCGGDYQAKISGPMLDRIDIQVDVPAVAIDDLQGVRTGETSETIKKRVEHVRAIQAERYGSQEELNAHTDSTKLDLVAPLEKSADELLKSSAKLSKMSARGYYKILRVARTIADLESVKTGIIPEKITKTHLAEALGYRKISL